MPVKEIDKGYDLQSQVGLDFVDKTTYLVAAKILTTISILMSDECMCAWYRIYPRDACIRIYPGDLQQSSCDVDQFQCDGRNRSAEASVLQVEIAVSHRYEDSRQVVVAVGVACEQVEMAFESVRYIVRCTAVTRASHCAKKL